MLELLLCSLLTIFPDYLYRRYRQGKRIGKDHTVFRMVRVTVGITACLMLTVALITVIFYFHPSTTTATLFFRTVPIIPDTTGRVSEVLVDFSAPVKKDDVIFKLDSARQEAAVETARRKIAELDAALVAAQVNIVKAEAQIQEAKNAYQQASDEVDVKRDLQKRNPCVCPRKFQALARVRAARFFFRWQTNQPYQTCSLQLFDRAFLHSKNACRPLHCCLFQRRSPRSWRG
jgi:multidrug resistance efflux pump